MIVTTTPMATRKPLFSWQSPVCFSGGAVVKASHLVSVDTTAEYLAREDPTLGDALRALIGASPAEMPLLLSADIGLAFDLWPASFGDRVGWLVAPISRLPLP
eukprot:CAMPEP_0169208558 /NCGR_PEP_ID=MMETSP1016-20121227/14192_1 /TAXON_ID=342587 /ORGANISM="Karlodinium micrum, Strain CCMP2283" /LENGTH=102 /DNA_ID=CAMNT_0009285933 /DNA_START=1645 /DNA_END=1954 /DNA_ORIENTATION=-